MSTTNELQDLREQAAAAGVKLSGTRHQNAIKATRNRAIANERDQQDNRTKTEKWIAEKGDGLTIGVITILTVVLLPLVLVGLIVAEWSRVKDGIMLFDAAVWRGNLIAAVLVIAYIVLLTIKEHEANRHGQLEQTAWSVLTWWDGVSYRLGLKRDWQPRRVTSTQQAGQVVGALFWIIVLLGTAGAMSEKLGEVEGVWYEGLAAIATESSLLDLLIYLGGFLVAFGLLRASHWAVRYLYEQYLRLRPEVAGLADDAGQEAADAAECQYIQEQLAKGRAKAAPKTPPVPVIANSGASAGSYQTLNR